MTFRIGDKVRSKLNKNLIGIVDCINVWYENTIDVKLNDGNMIAYSNQNNWELYFEIGDIVTHKLTSKIYRIYDNSNNDGFELERINNEGFKCTRINVLPDDIQMASDAEKSEFYRLKELHETKEKETKDMTSYKVGDYVDHPLYNESVIVDISEFETGYISIMPLTGTEHGKTKLVSIGNLKKIDEFLISTENYNEMVNTIENLKEENYKLYTKILSSKLISKHKLPEVKSVLYHKPATIIFWKDGTKTVVKAQKKEKYDNEKGFVMAYLKKILGNKGNYYEEIKRWTDTQ